jgi:hypothetical protein
MFFYCGQSSYLFSREGYSVNNCSPDFISSGIEIETIFRIEARLECPD